MMASNSVCLLREIVEKLDQLQDVVSRLLPSNTPPCVPVTFTLCELNSKIGRDSFSVWQSPPFYSHPRGYKLVLCVYHSSIYNAPSTSGPVPCNDLVTASDESSASKLLYREQINILNSELNVQEGFYANIFLVKGEFDDYLRFPLFLSLDVHVLIGRSGDSRVVGVAYDETTPPQYSVPGQTLCLDKSRDQWLCDTEQLYQYTVSNCLAFRVTNIHLNTS